MAEAGSLARAFSVIERLSSEGVVESYAIVGAVAALFYAEPTRTYDLDVAVVFPRPSRALVSLSPLYAWLRERGFEPEGEHVRIHGVPVQFLSGEPPLWNEAIREARRFEYEGVRVRVAGPEHLVAMALEAPSARRRERAALLIESGAVDRAKLNTLLERYRLALPEGFDA